MPPLSIGKNKSIVHTAKRVVEAAAKVAEIYATYPKNAGLVDYAGFALRCADALREMHDNYKEDRVRSGFSFFEDNPNWKLLPADIGKVAFSYVAEAHPVEGYWNGQQEGYLMAEGMLGQCRVRWIQDGTAAAQAYRGPYYLREHETFLVNQISAILWADIGSTSVVYSKGKLSSYLSHAPVEPTEEADSLFSRVRRFFDSGISRSYIIVGPPRAGKSTAIRSIAERLNLKTLRISVSSLENEDGASEGSVSYFDGVRTAIRLLQADVLVFEDLDRLISESADLLDLLEVARENSKIVLASANCTDVMMGAAVRPGRFDDVVNYTGLSKKLLKELNIEEEEECERLSKLPVAYAVDYARRKKVLGPQQALIELGELEDRCKRIGESP